MSDPTPSFPILADPPEPQQVWIIRPRRHRWWLHILLLCATFLTTTLVGAHMHSNFVHGMSVFSIDDDLGAFLKVIERHPSALLLGLPFSLTLMVILMAHEMGHYLYARHYHVDATLPFFIPFPSLIGTLGAFIRIKSPIPSRDALFDIGIAGPLAGFLPACTAVGVGLLLSHPLATASAMAGNQLGRLPLIFHLAARVLHLRGPLGMLTLHPIAAAGWVGMFATSLNLLPGGQLDGGHIIYSVWPKMHRAISLFTVVALIPLTKYFWIGWLLWSVVLWLTSYHPPVPSRKAISGSRKLVTVLALLMLMLSFSPEPFRGGSGQDVWPDVRDGTRDLMHSFGAGARHLLHRK